MDIRTKLVFALVATALGSMLVLGGFAWWIARDMLQQAAQRQLESVAESKHRDLERVYAGWHESVNLIRSRTQLRLSLAAWNRDRSPEERARIARILEDARRASHRVRHILVFSPDGSPVASTGPATTASWARREPGPSEELRFHGIAQETGSPVVGLTGSMTLEGDPIGSIAVVLDAGDLFDVTGDYTGLGATGETVIARREPDAGARIINPVRHDAASPLSLTLPGALRDTAIVRAVNGESGAFLDGAVDYRDVPVWAAARHLEPPDWGVVTKVDEAEARAPVIELRNTLLRLGLSLSAFAVLLGTALGVYFAKPIRALAELADRVRHGERDLRADVTGAEDEVGLLATALNEMLDEVQGAAHGGGEGAPTPSPRGA